MPKTAAKPTVKEIVKTLMDAKEAYYAGTPIMSDTSFDQLEDMLRETDPDNAYFEVVGATGNTKTKVQHEVPMLSAGKAKTTDEAWAWLEKISATAETILVEPKIDGLSATIRYEKGKLVQIATRGDGKVGQDITHIAPFIQGIVTDLGFPHNIEVRGELYIPKNSKVPNPDGKPLRNMAVGFINRKGEKHSLEDLRWVKFMGYQIIGADKFYNTESDKISFLKSMDFNVIEVQKFCVRKSLDKIHADYLATKRAEWEFETDGLVLVVDDIKLHAKIDSLYEVRHHHHYNLALKPPSVSKETELLSIEWNVSRIGRLIPVAIVKPVEIGGRLVQRASLTCYENVIRMKFEKGDKVMIEIANDVIPYLAENITKSVRQRK